MKTFGCAAFAPMRMRSPRTAPPLIGLDGSIAITAIAWPCASQAPSSASTSVDLPLPGTPVMPTTQARPARCGERRRGLARARARRRRSASAGARARAGRRDRPLGQARAARRARASARSPRPSASPLGDRRGRASRHRQTMTSGWPKPRSRRSRGADLLVRQAGARAVDDGAEDVAVVALGGAREVVERLARPRRAERAALAARNSSRWRRIAAGSGRSTGGRFAASSSAWYSLTPTTTCSPALDALLEAHRRGADHALHEARPRPPCTCRRRRRSSS